jgi:isopenicillin N synthase-like dioxygenase
MAVIQTGNGIRNILSEGLDAKQVPFNAIPVIDFSAMRSADLAARQLIAQQLCEACIRVGFFYIKNHGVPQEAIDGVFSQTKRFFSLPLEEKMRIHISKSPNHRGYVPLLEENTDPVGKGDLHEAFDCALDVPADDPDLLAGKILYGPNVWPDNLPGFRESLDRYYWHLYDLGRNLFQAFALALELPEDFFEDKITKPIAQLRLLHYPPQNGPIDEKQIGTGAHSDYDCFTILAQDNVGGLQVLNSAGEWIADNMARWTNDLFSSTVHRAVNRSDRDRYSIPFFFGPNYDTLIETLPSCVGPNNPAKYEAVTAGEYLLNRFNETFTYRK